MRLKSEIRITFNPSMAKVARKFGNINVKGFLQKKVDELAFLVEREAKLVTPVGETGHLRGRMTTDVGNLRAKIQTNVPYDIFVHEGTRYMRARPFMFWGAQTAGKGFDMKIAKDLEVEIQRKVK